ncbi:aldo/keto reductase [Roseobacter sp. HKCCD9010]|uniref:aldo/keto reductase n=1 Tax=unclassified Roseobacter TaxID=196798 RepID=UPI0014930FB7|nr:aldo/keto reductase [Rhodobacterales bacterium HKCCD4356]NNV14273.1 aldo/keto reductase [Roseobacter sp. HKCCD7357]NNV18466.1 aldo/keto reductase [Roseobacter sp. HKCCD8768]NNV27906.1 aldo/keto reductase [Roseobacter sp. HKCCD8192]NNV32198.1 aldo/keto reductase [Roseobacter sp. HKCCD9061]NNV36430.1 aldo/keto reductase [Roseobacter sp. HKCCD9073]NNV40716.1 aldo/keto reductase [Roseobacter sp. HKCCD9054]NNV44968.1 aldo/keto reductase [Roseobacter sp. HKCCD6497]NNV49229.1 aldo/keto reductas
MENRRNALSGTSINLPQLGLGTASLAGLFNPVTDKDATATIQGALDAGMPYVDTAPFYGHGRSERLVGDALRGRDDVVLSTKVGRLLRPGASEDPGAWVQALPFHPVYDYSYDGVMRSYEHSLQRLGVDRIDILFMHDIGDLTHGPEAGPALFKTAMDGGYRALDELRSSGTIAAIGLGVNEAQVCLDALQHGDWNVFLLAGRYTLLEQDPLENLMPACAAARTDVVIGGPFNSGVLVGGDTFDYDRIPESVASCVRSLTEVCDAHGVPLPAAALHFPLAHPVVKSAIPGPRTAKELQQIQDWWTHEIPDVLWDDLKSQSLLHPDAPTPKAGDRL